MDTVLRDEQAIVITNTCWIGENIPCLIYGLRGLIEVEGMPATRLPFFVCLIGDLQSKYAALLAICTTVPKAVSCTSHIAS